MIFSVIIAIATGYLLGSIPFAYITGHLVKGVDIRQVGGGNMGTLNVAREIGLLPDCRHRQRFTCRAYCQLAGSSLDMDIHRWPRRRGWTQLAHFSEI